MPSRPMIDRNAQALADRTLEVTRHALMSDNFELFAPEIALPHHVTTPEGSRRLDSEADIRASFDAVVSHFQEMQVVDLRRTIETAFFVAQDRLYYSYASQLRFADKTKDEPYYCHATMALTDGAWRLTETFYALGTREQQARAIMHHDGQLSSEDPEAKSILQEVLEDLTDSFMQSDFDRYAGRIKLPFFVQGDEGSRIYLDLDHLFADLRDYRTQFRIIEVTDYIRSIKSAERIGERRIQGIYRNHVLSGTQIMMEPFVSAITLEQGEDGIWRATSVLNPVRQPRNAVLRPEPELDS